MSDSEVRPHRAGLGLPPAVIIKSAPLPPKTIRTLAEDFDSPSRFQDHSTWKEWNINPAKHGPERLTRPPVFLPSQQTYDELGRSLEEGYEVKVGDGVRREVEDGGRVADWYLAISRGSTPGAGPSRPTTRLIAQERPVRDSSPTDPSENPIAPRAVEIARSLRRHRRDWFINHAQVDHNQSTRPSPGIQATSISSLLSITPTQPRVPPAHYVLGPENKGYSLLRDRLGWEGGGLGRPAGWTAADLDRRKVGKRSEEVVIQDMDEKPELDRNGNTVVDLTAASDTDEAVDGEPVSHGGPGRTAPIATSLKLDRLGIGHRRARPANSTDIGKKVTHTASQIREAQRRAKYRAVKGVELGKKGKVRWRERDKKEGESRRRLAAALNA